MGLMKFMALGDGTYRITNPLGHLELGHITLASKIVAGGQQTILSNYNTTYGGFQISGDLFATTVAGSDAGKTYARLLDIIGTSIGASENAAGCVVITTQRGTSYPFGTAGTGGWGGAEDMALRVNAYNSAANTNLKGGIRALRVYTRQYSGGQIANMYSALIDLDERGSGGTSGVSCAVAVCTTISMRINGVVSTNATVLRVEDNSQGTIQASTCTGNNMIAIRSNSPIASGAKPTCIHFEVTGSGSGWTHAFSFQSAAGKEGFTQIADGDLKGKVNGYIKVYDVATAQTLYILCYDTAPSA